MSGWVGMCPLREVVAKAHPPISSSQDTARLERFPLKLIEMLEQPSVPTILPFDFVLLASKT